jgi:hypothetical protein
MGDATALKWISDVGLIALLVYVVVRQLPAAGGKAEQFGRWAIGLHFSELREQRLDCTERVRKLEDRIAGLTERLIPQWSGREQGKITGPPS